MNTAIGQVSKTEQVAELNDAFRKNGFGGRLLIARSLWDLGEEVVKESMDAVREFDSFTVANDPHGEHDFGAVVVRGNWVFWKIDYYDTEMEYCSDDPSDPEKTTRVMTLMLADGY